MLNMESSTSFCLDFIELTSSRTLLSSSALICGYWICRADWLLFWFVGPGIAFTGWLVILRSGTFMRSIHLLISFFIYWLLGSDLYTFLFMNSRNCSLPRMKYGWWNSMSSFSLFKLPWSMLFTFRKPS